MSSYETATRQAEFLNELSCLMNKYDAKFRVDTYPDGGADLEIDACGTWIPFYNIGCYFDVDKCIAATAATIEHAKAVATANERPPVAESGL